MYFGTRACQKSNWNINKFDTAILPLETVCSNSEKGYEMYRVYYEIDEVSAKRSHEMMSFSDFQEGSVKEEYKQMCDRCYDIADKIEEERPDKAEYASILAKRYAARLSDYFNRDAQIGCMCPSVLIAGPSNFPVKKKERQIAAWEKNQDLFRTTEAIKEKLIKLLYAKDAIKSGDADASERLKEKLRKLEEEQEKMKAVNAYYRKNHTLDGCPSLTPEEIESLKASMGRGWRSSDKPYEAYMLSNNNANIRRIRKRIEEIESRKSVQSDDVQYEDFKVVRNADIMRIQLIFDEKPDEKTRTILKENGFKWSPRNTAWQRHLNNNGEYALKRVLEKIEAVEAQADVV